MSKFGKSEELEAPFQVEIFEDCTLDDLTLHGDESKLHLKKGAICNIEVSGSSSNGILQPTEYFFYEYGKKDEFKTCLGGYEKDDFDNAIENNIIRK